MLVIVKPVFVDTRKRALERVAGSIVGGALAALLAASIHNVVALDILLLVFSVLAYSHMRQNYGLYVLFLTPLVGPNDFLNVSSVRKHPPPYLY